MPTAVNVFNASSHSLSLMINAGDPVKIAATGATQNWLPQQPTANAPTFTGGNPAPNAFGYATVEDPNMILVKVADFPGHQTIKLPIPKSPHITALEIYLIGGDAANVNWYALNAGV